MKVTKIDIKKELYDHNESHGPIVWFVKPFVGQARIMKDGEYPGLMSIHVEEESYEIHKVTDGQRSENYLVKIDDRQLFKDLLAVREGTMKRLERKAREDGYWEGMDKFRKSVKELPWYKRLFNQF